MGSPSSNRLIVSILVVAALAIGFWMLALSPKRQEADKLAGQAEQLQVALTEARGKALEAATARREFPSDYKQLVVLGKAVPDGAETPSLFVDVNHVANQSKVKFNSINLEEGGEAAESVAAPVAPATTTPSTGSSSAVPAAATIPPTEAAASLLPLGARIGTAGLGVMPYNLNFSGDFFHVADFIKGIDSLVKTGGSEVAVDGRLVTLDGFALSADPELGFPHLNANFKVTTYLTPPSQGVTVGATPSAPAPSTATPAATEPPATESTPVSEAR
jgi:Tfp pilus assembly protein PilO